MVLDNAKHEQFAQLVAKGLNATKAYISAGYSANGARAGAARLGAKATVCARIRELQEAISKQVIRLEISTRNTRLSALQRRHDGLSAAFDKMLDEQGADMVDIPGGSTGLLCKDYKGKEATQRVARVKAIAAELRATECQAAQETGDWNKPERDKGKIIDVTPAVVSLGMICTKEQLQEMREKALALRRLQQTQEEPDGV